MEEMCGWVKMREERERVGWFVLKPQVQQNASHRQINIRRRKSYRDNKQRTREIRRKKRDRKVGPEWHMIFRYLH